MPLINTQVCIANIYCSTSDINGCYNSVNGKYHISTNTFFKFDFDEENAIECDDPYGL